MISNRQGGRRRGRGGGSGRAPNLNTGGGNRQDNRQRGNAAQLLEKYKGLARDMQMQGDRVQTEYYLQFADHYYRVLNENRARFEEQRPQRGDFDSGYDDEDQDENESGRDGVDESEAREPVEAQGRRDHRREPSREPNREASREGNGEMRPRRARSRRPDEGDYGRDDEPSGLPADLLPPAISTSSDDGDEPEARAPRRRPRRPRSADEEIAPAA